MLNNVKKGDVVTRKSYNNDVIFIVDLVINNKIAILTGITTRLKADSPIDDLEIISKKEIDNIYKKIDEKIDKISNKANEKKDGLLKRSNKVIYTGKILHLDGDRRYSEKSMKYYKKMGLDAIVKNIPENKQAIVVRQLLEKYKPDVLVITGHDAMLKKGINYSNIYNYRNSKNFINTVKEARKWAKSSNRLVIFAGACQSFFEALIEAGADFASSPGRILIDFVDPLIVAEKIAVTDRTKFVSSYEIAREIKEGEEGISGIGAMGKKTRVTIM